MLVKVMDPLDDPIIALNKAFKNKNVELARKIIKDNGLVIRDGKVFASEEDTYECKYRSGYFKMLQQIRKILLNSLYGSLLNKGSRFYDKRLGQSVTLTGRSITKHMASTINHHFTGEYTHTGGVVYYGDTDSVYFSAHDYFKSINKDFEFTTENVVALYQEVGEVVSKSFPLFMDKTFNTGLVNGRIIDAGLEAVGISGLFWAKKRYVMLKVWDDGFYKDPADPDSLKAMGIEIKRSDTMKYIQEFLHNTLMKLLNGASESELRDLVRAFKKDFANQQPWLLASPKTIKKFSKWVQVVEAGGRCSVGHVSAALNWNTLREMAGDKRVPAATDGTRIYVCKLKPSNQYGMKTVGYPADVADNLPEWFKNLPFDWDAMEKAVIEKKLTNLFSILDMDIGINESSKLSLDNPMFVWD